MTDRPRTTGRLVLLHSGDPDALLAHAAAPFCVRGRPAGRLPLLALRQGGIRDQIQDRAARAGCAGWLGSPIAVFAELPTLIAGELAPLDAFERRVILEGLLARTPLRRLGDAARHRRFVEAIDRFFGDLVSERVPAERIAAPLAGLRRDGWEEGRDEDLAALYSAYLDALRALPSRDGVARSDGRDGRTLAAEALRDRPDEVRRRLRRPFGTDDEPLTLAIYGLNDLRRGWDHLLDALRAVPFVDELRVYLPLDAVVGTEAAVEREELEAIGEHELLDALLERRPDDVVRVAPRPADDPLAPLRASLFRGGAATRAHTPATPVRALAAPDMARELETVARRVKRLIVRDGVAPHTIAVVSRKSRPYGPRVVELLRRHGVPVSARLRSNLTEVSAVAALLRVHGAAAHGFTWRAIAELAESPYFDLDLDAGLLKRASTRGRLASLASWSAALEAMAAEAAYEAEAGNEGYRGPDAGRIMRAAASFAAFRETAERFTASRARREWITLALHCLGRGVDGEREPGAREGLWGLCRNACRPPHDEDDALVVEATRRDTEALGCLAELLGGWRDALALRDGAGDEKLSASAWHDELLEALDDVEIALSTPHRRGVQVLEASAAAWAGFDHLFLVGMNAGDFPAEPAGRELYAEHERGPRYAAGLPLEPAGVWFAREASLLRILVAGARRSLHVSYAYADSAGAPQIPSSYFDEIVSRYSSPAGEKADAWVEVQPGSLVAPARLDDVWCTDDLQLFAARHRGDDAPDRKDEAALALAHLACQEERRSLVARVLAAAGVEHERRLLREAPAEEAGDRVRPWNGAVTSPDLLEALAERFGDAVWSASQLETYGRCPFTFFATYVLGVRSLEEPDDEMDGATRGELVHVCLERLYSALTADFKDETLTPASLKQAERLIPTIVTRTLDEFEKTGRGGVPALRGYRERELCALLESYLAWEVAENEKAQRRATPRRRPALFELVFGMNGRPPVSLQSGGRVLKLRGKIDRVDELTEDPVRGWRYVVDHKTGDGSLTPLDLYDHGALLQLPLYIRALEALGEHGEGAWGGAYQIAKGDCKRAGPLHPRTLEKGGKVREGSNKTEQTAASRIHDSVALALRHVDAIQRGEFPARIPSCATGCPTFCDYKDVCREDRLARGGPKR